MLVAMSSQFAIVGLIRAAAPSGYYYRPEVGTG
jgi:hypothetical protein